jgi:RNA polymerase sigma-70 factor (ECF subfamily)
VGDDAELLERLRAGDEVAFAGLVRRYQPSLLRLATTFVDSRAVAEEVVQDTWLGVVRGVERFEGRSSFRTWLFRILVNRARTAGGRELRAGRPARDEDVTERFDASGAWETPPVAWADRAEDQLVARNLAARVHELLPELPDGQREVLLLHDVEGLPTHEVAMLLGITEGNGRVLLHRGRARVRARLEAEIETGTGRW